MKGIAVVKLIDFLLDIIWPNRCVFCNKVIPWNEKYCLECYDKLELTDDRLCKRCGQYFCMCKRNKYYKIIYPYYETCVCVANYTTSAKDLILNLKYKESKISADFAGEMIYNKMDLSVYNNPIVISVPMTKKALRKRGFNQSELIANKVAKLSGFEYNDNILIKVKETATQKTLTEAQRRKNLIKAFAVTDKELIKGREILVIDDVTTTGATLNECAKVLKRAGAKRIHAATFATTTFY